MKILRAFLRKSEKPKNPIFDKKFNFSFLGTFILWAMVLICTIQKIGRPNYGRKMKTEKKLKKEKSMLGSRVSKFLKIPKAANFLDNFAPLMFTKFFSMVNFWCLKVPWKILKIPGFSGKKLPENFFPGRKFWETSRELDLGQD